jgi:hypothetical protein
MGVDVQLMLDTEKVFLVPPAKMCMAKLGRRYHLREGERIEMDQDRLWPQVNKIEEEIKKKIGTLIFYNPKDWEEGAEIQNEMEIAITGWVEELVQYGRKILLANVLQDSAGHLKVEDC